MAKVTLFLIRVQTRNERHCGSWVGEYKVEYLVESGGNLIKASLSEHYGISRK